jgi:voltage-gated potassium channel
MAGSMGRQVRFPLVGRERKTINRLLRISGIRWGDTVSGLRKRLQSLYFGHDSQSRWFRFAILAFDLATIAFFVVSSLMHNARWIILIDFAIAIVIMADLTARAWIATSRRRYFTQLTTWADILIVITLLLPAFVESLLFLRVLRALRLLRSYHVLYDLRNEFTFFKRNEEIIQSVINLLVFVFIMTALVYVLQVRFNPQIDTYIDALYYTVTALTTTGFGDVTLQGTTGRLLAVLIMVVGVALFLRLVQTIFRPAKVRHECPECGLTRHDPDAVHCKHCGLVLHIETEGAEV